MPAWAFKDRITATTLKRMAQEYRSGSGSASPLPSQQRVTPLRHYLLVPIEDIPAAQRVVAMDEDGQNRRKLLLGSGLCYIHRRDISPTAEDWFEANDGTNLFTKYQRDDDGEPVSVRAYNTSSETYEAESAEGQDIPDCGPILHAVSDMWGDLYIVRDASLDPCSSLSSSASDGECCQFTYSFKEHRFTATEVDSQDCYDIAERTVTVNLETCMVTRSNWNRVACVSACDGVCPSGSVSDSGE